MLKNCFICVFSASRLGRRPKRLKNSSGEQKRETNVPIAPYPSSPSELYKLRMAELQKLLQQNGTFKSELMQAFLQAAQHSFREHQRNNNANDNQKNKKNSTSTPKTSESGYTSSTSSLTGNSPSDPADVMNKNTRTTSIDTKMGIIEDSLDNFNLGSGSTSPARPDNVKTEAVTSPTSTMFPLSEIKTEFKTEPELDNSMFNAMTDNSNNMVPPSMSGCASPMFMMPELSPETMMMMPDMMEMMKDMDPQMMMGGMPPMPGRNLIHYMPS